MVSPLDRGVLVRGALQLRSLIRVFWQSSPQQVAVNRLHVVYESAYRSISLDTGMIRVCL